MPNKFQIQTRCVEVLISNFMQLLNDDGVANTRQADTYRKNKCVTTVS